MTLVCITNDVRGLIPCAVAGEHKASCDGFAYRWYQDDSLSLSSAPNLPGRRWERRLVAIDKSLWPSHAALVARRADVEAARVADLEQPDVDDRARYRINKLYRERLEGLHPLECSGCVPREANHGVLCWSCWEKTRDALSIGVDMVTHLASIDRAQQIDNAGVRVATAWVIPTPATWRLADDMLTTLGMPDPGLPSTASVDEVAVIVDDFFADLDVEMLVSTVAGAEQAVRFYRLMQTAMNQHPMEEYEHRVRNVRCPVCKRRSLLWKPPLAHLDSDPENGRVRVVCTTRDCGHEMDEGAYEKVAEIEEIASNRRRKPTDTTSTSATGFDQTPESLVGIAVLIDNRPFTVLSAVQTDDNLWDLELREMWPAPAIAADTPTPWAPVPIANRTMRILEWPAPDEEEVPEPEAAE